MRKVLCGALVAIAATWSFAATAAQPGTRGRKKGFVARCCRQRPSWRSANRESARYLGSRNATEGVPYILHSKRPLTPAPQPGAKAAAETPQVEVKVKIAEFNESDRAEIDRVLGIPKGLAGAADDKTARSLEKRKLLRVRTSPTIRTQSGFTASVRSEYGQGVDRQGNVKPITHETEILPTITSDKEPQIAAEIRYRETIGKGKTQRVREIDTGVKLKLGETYIFHLSAQPPAAAKNAAPAGDIGRLLFVKATIVKPKSAVGKTLTNPRLGDRKSPAKR